MLHKAVCRWLLVGTSNFSKVFSSSNSETCEADALSLVAKPCHEIVVRNQKRTWIRILYDHEYYYGYKSHGSDSRRRRHVSFFWKSWEGERLHFWSSLSQFQIAGAELIGMEVVWKKKMKSDDTSFLITYPSWIFRLLRKRSRWKKYLTVYTFEFSIPPWTSAKNTIQECAKFDKPLHYHESHVHSVRLILWKLLIFRTFLTGIWERFYRSFNGNVVHRGRLDWISGISFPQRVFRKPSFQFY